METFIKECQSHCFTVARLCFIIGKPRPIAPGKDDRLFIYNRSETELIKLVTESPLLWDAWYELARMNSKHEPTTDNPLYEHYIAERFLFNLKTPPGSISNPLLNRVLQCAIWYKERNYEDAIKMLSTIPHSFLEVCPNLLELYSHCLHIAGDAGRLAYLARTIKSPSSAYLVLMGNYWSLQRNHKQAAICFKQALRITSSVEHAILLAQELCALDLVIPAAKTYLSKITESNADPRLLYGLGKLYEGLEAFERATHFYLRAAQQDPSNWRYWEAAGKSLKEAHQPEASLFYLHKALELHSSNDLIIIAAQCYEELKKHDMALSLYERLGFDSEHGQKRELLRRECHVNKTVELH